MARLPVWIKVLLATLAVGLMYGAARLMLYFDRLGASKFDL